MVQNVLHGILNDLNANVRLFSYVVARDYGFAPNPFYGACTLATCKPEIRKHASVGDWVIGTGSKGKDRQRHLVYVMCVHETMTFNEYWEDGRFQRKKPNLRGSLKQAFGDNIYFLDKEGQWQQLNSHHSYNDGTPNLNNVKNDTQVNRVLFSTEYAYWGNSGPEIPQEFCDYNGVNICCYRRGYKSKFPEELVSDFLTWFRSLDENGYLGTPLDWPKIP